MPFYVISHKDDITPQQRDDLAATITRIHTTLFTTPALFVNVKYEDSSAASYYVGGKRVSRDQRKLLLGSSGSRKPECKHLSGHSDAAQATRTTVLASNPLQQFFVLMNSICERFENTRS